MREEERRGDLQVPFVSDPAGGGAIRPERSAAGSSPASPPPLGSIERRPAESKNGFTNVHGSRGHFDEEILLGPSVQWRPFPAAHVDVAPLFGLTEKSVTVKLFMLAGWEF